MKKYIGFPFEFKITEEGAVGFWILETPAQFAEVDFRADKVQQWTGAVDRNGNKVFFGDTLRFADKVEWYRGDYWAKLQLGIMTRDEALAEIETLPYHEIVVTAGFDLEYLESDDMKLYFEVVNDPKP